MAFLKINNINAIVVDFTSHCNAMCGNCSRNIDGVVVNPNMPLSHMDLDTWKRIVDNAKGVEEIIFNGAYGDPLMNPQLPFALKYAQKLKCKIMIHTNGGIGKPNLYRMIAQDLRNFPQGVVTFSIDGLKDTNHLYRRNVVWENVMENAKAFIDAGGLARWRMLVFEHNKHQLEECQRLAYDMGFVAFDVNGGYTFSAINGVVSEAIEKFKANKKSPAHTVKYDTSKLDQLERIRKLQKDYGSLENAFIKAPIECKWRKKRKIQISHTGEVFPCCYMLSDRYPKNPDSTFAKDVASVNWQNINNYSLEEILNSEWWDKTLPNSWDSENRYEICARTCSK